MVIRRRHFFSGTNDCFNHGNQANVSRRGHLLRLGGLTFLGCSNRFPGLITNTFSCHLAPWFRASRGCRARDVTRYIRGYLPTLSGLGPDSRLSTRLGICPNLRHPLAGQAFAVAGC